MKKQLFGAVLLFTVIAAKAQLAHTNWNGAVKGDNPQACIFKFGNDTAVLYAVDGSIIETMKFAIKNAVLTLTKISGQSDCNIGSSGKYKIAFTGNILTLSISNDDCIDRSSALNITRWVKITAK
jgi:hypothetical protein